MTIAWCPDNEPTSRHILLCRDGCIKFATSSTDIRCRDPSRAAESTTESTTERDTRSGEGGPTCFSCWYQPHHGSLFLCLVPSPSVLPDFPLLPVAAFTHRIRLWPGLSGLSFLPFSFPFSCCNGPVCSPDTPPGPSVTTYVSFRSVLAAAQGKAAFLLWLLSLWR